LVLGARPALAAEGGIEILPDWTGVLPILLVLFAVLIFPVNRLIFQPLFRVLDEREMRIDGARARAHKVEEEAQAVLGRYEDAVADARGQAAAERKAALAEAREDEKAATGEARAVAEGEIERARREIAASLAEAREGLRPRAEELAREAAERILGRSL
jgi:F-type H+-transporting ATPase subunit b